MNPLEERGEVTLPNGAVYKGMDEGQGLGQWKGEMRHGFGIQIWPDGAKYEGEWRNNKAHGKGKFYHVEGDVYDGEWVEDKVCSQSHCRRTVTECTHMPTEPSTKAPGKTICKMVSGSKHGKTRASMKGPTRKA